MYLLFTEYETLKLHCWVENYNDAISLFTQCLLSNYSIALLVEEHFIQLHVAHQFHYGGEVSKVVGHARAEDCSL